ncbi:MAG TPA: phage holin family protein [Streptosporangiaceae bacterium]|nr:phage holin family protein [Streptosporangiaceae bacterium]
MADPAVRRAAAGVADQSIGDLVSVAARDISQLVRYELDLAKLELKADAKRLGFGAGLGVVALFAVCLVLMLLCFAFAFGLNAIGAPGGLWGAFLWVALTCAILIVVAGFVAWRLVRHLTGMRSTRRSLADGMSLLHRGKPASATKAAAKG